MKESKLLTLTIALCLVWPCGVTLAQAFPYSPPEGQLRIVIWNIEFLGAREPLRTTEQLDDLSERLLSFEGDIFLLQEISVGSVLENVASNMGPEWVAVTIAVQNAMLYNSSRVELLDSRLMYFLSVPGYDVYPGAGNRIPILGRYRLAGTNDVGFDVIGIHFHWSEASINIAEGEAMRLKIEAMLADQNGLGDIIFGGDVNARPEQEAHPWLVSGGVLHRFPKANGDTTTSGGARLDHLFINTEAVRRVPTGTSYVIRPEHYGETNQEWDATYSDHFPVFIDYIPNRDHDLDGLIDTDEVRDLDPGTGGTQNPFDPLEADSTGDSGQDTPDGKPDSQNDYDGDGMSNRDEFAFGYNPLDAGSWAELPAVTVVGISVFALLAFAAILVKIRHARASEF